MSSGRFHDVLVSHKVKRAVLVHAPAKASNNYARPGQRNAFVNVFSDAYVC
eukprot:CAMPEP_0198361300 /NCGR_PEP_ID=MMETSP1450-20131203/141707_1 /TAXON_ID=753684 ORGANISM="Madagascaria erythrocladiodes, Strain CCMP3234" /NCGR_SAMPLE_ID=MMETSP1450 /ASSEMBLY_ACC=CAM_ASM_001115 /LENGTH=50 /DNA_ID=CAMNT_0044068403 /DNA_START=99 /DNA_END=248 /DNA_ORIENTATION=+